MPEYAPVSPNEVVDPNTPYNEVMPEYAPVSPNEVIESGPNTPPPYMDPSNSALKKKSMIQHKKSVMAGQIKRCEHCGAFPQQQMVIWPAPRPENRIRPDNSKFIGYVILIAVVIFLLFAACKYLP